MPGENDGEYKITKYPIVLVHGAILKDTFFLRSFGRIDRELRKLGYDVTVVNTDAFGTVEHNAEIIKTVIEDMIKNRGCEKVNLIGYSKGGMDVLYMLEHLGCADLAASFSSLCATHKGTPVASWLLRRPKWFLRAFAFIMNTAYRILGDKKPDFLKVCEQLSRSSYGDDVIPAIGGVYCQSYHSTFIKGEKKNDFLMKIPYAVSRRCEKDVITDGLAPHDSTLFGVCRGDCIEGSYSHSELVDLFARRSKKPKIYAFYASLCSELAEMGF